MGLGVATPALFHLENGPDLEFLPTLSSNVDHPSIQADAFACLLAITLLGQHGSFYWVM